MFLSKISDESKLENKVKAIRLRRMAFLLGVHLFEQIRQMDYYCAMKQEEIKHLLEGLSTEEKIKAAAVHVFTHKGYEAATTRDIAELAGLKNVAGLHYYFRTKDKLFDVVIEETMADFSKLMDRILNGSRPLYQKIKSFAVAYTDFLIDKPFLPMFILNEGEKNPERIDYMMNDSHHLPLLRQQIKEEISRGAIRPISLENFLSNLIGLVIFPFVSKSLMKLKTGLDDQSFLRMLEERKTIVPEMLIGYLYLKPPIEG